MGCLFLPLTKNHIFFLCLFISGNPFLSMVWGPFSCPKFWHGVKHEAKSNLMRLSISTIIWPKGRKERKKEGRKERRKERRKSLKKSGLELGNYSSILPPNNNFYSWWTASSSPSTGLSKVLHTFSHSVIIIIARSLTQLPPHSIISILRMQKLRVRVLKRLAQSPSPPTTKAMS